MRIKFCSVSNRVAAKVFANSVLPTPVGPRKRKLPIGRLGSLFLLEREEWTLQYWLPLGLVHDPLVKHGLKRSNFSFSPP